MLAILTIAIRLPMLLSAVGATNSDSAVVGLQALHLAAGTEKIAPFLWGSHYQTSADSLLASLAFRAFGASPTVLMATSLAGHLALTLFVYLTLARVVGRSSAFLLALFLVISGAPVNGYALFPPRQLALTLSFASFYVFALARSARRPRLLSFFAGFLATLAIGADPYAMIFLPSIALFAFLSLRPSKWAIGHASLGAAMGAVPYLLITTRAGASHGTLGFSLDRLASNARLFAWPCLPWALGAIDFAPLHFLTWDRSHPSTLAAILSASGASVLLCLLAFSAKRLLQAIREKPSSESTARLVALSAAGWLGIALTVLAFFGSVMVMDLFSTRYLVSALLLEPFALAPMFVAIAPKVRRIGLLSASLFLALPLLANALSAFAAYGPFVQKMERGEDETALVRALDAEGVRYAYADYWAAYRLTFVTHEHVIAIPLHPAEDRYPPYRAAVIAEPRVAYIFDFRRSREGYLDVATDLANAGIEFRMIEPATTPGFEVLLAGPEAAQRMR